MGTTYVKDPQALLDYVVDWSGWLQSGESIVTSNFSISNTNVNGLTLSATVPAGSGGGPNPSNTSSAATIWLGGGLIGRSYSVVNQITTDMGRTNAKSFILRVADR